MAMITGQIGALSRTAFPVDASGNGAAEATTATVSAAAVWKSPSPSPALKCKAQRQRPGEIDALSPPVSPLRSPLRADLSAACLAFATAETEEALAEGEYVAGGGAPQAAGKGVPVYVMMPLDSVKMDNTVNRRKAMNASLQALKSAGVEGVMMDVWWGLVEREKPGEYNWGGYVELMEMAKKHGLKVQAVMSFHQCGGNVGDSVTYVSPLYLLSSSFVYNNYTNG